MNLKLRSQTLSIYSQPRPIMNKGGGSGRKFKII